MGKINEITEHKILAAAKVTDILDDMGVKLYRQGANLTALCPFHEDRNTGNFIVSESKNICTCYACGVGTMNPKKLLAKWKGWDLKNDYPKVLRYLAAKYGIYVDDEPVPEVKKAAPREELPELPMVVFNKCILEHTLRNKDKNPLLNYLRGLRLNAEDKARLEMMIGLYAVGTSVKESTMGWTIWWQIDVDRRIRTGKLMAYKEDGHRDKDKKYSFNWVHSMIEKSGGLDLTKKRVEPCLFGEHLVDCFKDAEICLVESEKSALICSAYTDPDKRLWLATAGKGGLSRKKLQPLIDRGRYIVIYPDKDGYDEWCEIADMIGYSRLSVSNKINELWEPVDGPKADIADIMLRRNKSFSETDAEKAARRLDAQDKVEVLQNMIDQLDLKLQ